MTNDPTQFYVTLFCNASQTLYPKNMLGSSTAHLAQLIDMGSTDGWEVGVCEVTCHPPNVGTYKDIKNVGATKALIYCDLISQ